MITYNQNFLSILLFSLLISTVYTRTSISGLSESQNSVTVTGVQFNEIEFYDLTFNDQLKNMEYVIFEVSISDEDMKSIASTSSVNPMVCYEFNSDPVITFDSVSNKLNPCKNGFTYNQYQRASGKYSIDMATNLAYNQIVFAVYVQGRLISYSVRVRGKFQSSADPICPFDCGISGAVTSTNCKDRTCVCNSDRIDYDCSVIASQITDAGNLAINLSRTMMVYTYYQPSKNINQLDVADPVRIGFSLIRSAPSVSIYVSTWTQDPLKLVPTLTDFFKIFTIDGDAEQVLTINPNIMYNSKLQPVKVVFGMIISQDQIDTNENMVTIAIKGSISSDSFSINSLLIYSLLGVIVVLFIVWIFVTIAKIHYTNQNRVTHFDNNGVELNTAQRRARKSNLNKKLTIEIIEMHMPEIPFKEIQAQYTEKGKELSDSCAVCLCEFEESDMCRESTCSHVFHKDCLEQWLNKQENCPFCRADHSRETLTKQLEAKEKKKEAADVSMSDSVTAGISNQMHNVSGIPPPTEPIILTTIPPSVIGAAAQGNQTMNTMNESVLGPTNRSQRQSPQRVRRVFHQLPNRSLNQSRATSIKPMRITIEERCQQSSFLEDQSITIRSRQNQFEMSQLDISRGFSIVETPEMSRNARVEEISEK